VKAARAQTSIASFTVRNAAPADAPEMAAVHARSWQATYAGLVPDAVIDDVVHARAARTERWRAQLSQAARGRGAFVATMAGGVVGFVFWGPSEGSGQASGTAEVHAIYVDPSVTRRGIGRALLDAAVGDIAANRFTAAALWVLDTNAPARRFYEAAGWSADGETKAEHRAGGTLHELRYRRSITPSEQTPGSGSSSASA
jgi:ribosomal protein S18 acetylase RimI-like enzyme